MNLKGVILDIDGTFVDSNDLHARAWCEELERSGFPAHYTNVRALIGMGGDKLVPEVTNLKEGSKEAEALGKRRGELFREKFLPRVEAFLGSRELVERMLAEGLKVAVGSSAGKEELAPLLKIARIDDLIEEKTSSDDADHSKPDPDIIQAALKKLGLPASEVLMIGDTPYDVEAAAKAGVATIAVRAGGWDDKALAGAIAIYDGVGELLESFPDSPLSRANASAS